MLKITIKLTVKVFVRHVFFFNVALDHDFGLKDGRAPPALDLLVMMGLQVVNERRRHRGTVSLVTVQRKHPQATRTLQLVRAIVSLLEVVDDVLVGRAPEPTNGTRVRHFSPHVTPLHVVDQQNFFGEALFANSAHEREHLLVVDLVDVALVGVGVVELLEAVFALGEVRKVDGSRAIGIHMQAQVFHELDVVHEKLLTNVAFERHVRFEFLI